MDIKPIFRIWIYDETRSGSFAAHTLCYSWRQAMKWIDKHNVIAIKPCEGGVDVYRSVKQENR